MSNLYGDHHRQFQDAFETRKLADTVEHVILSAEVVGEERKFIESRDAFFLSTIDHLGRPSVSYKGGPKGFVRVVDNSTLAFPSYDGNGMFLSMGNISGNNKIGLLFIDFENPHRLRAYGEASVSADDALLGEFPEAQLIVRVKITEIWRNCPRYVHKYQRVGTSEYVPREDSVTPMPAWKKLDKLQDVLPPADQGKAAEHGGTLTFEQLAEMQKRND